MPPNTSRSVWLLAAALLPFAALVAYHWNWGAPAGFADHAQYLAHARALVEGKAYSDIGYIYHPLAPMLGPRAYPPGFPLSLVPLVAIGGTESWLIHAFMVATLVLFAYLAFRRLALAIAPWQAALATGFTLLGIETQFGSVVPLSDPGLCVLLWALVLTADKTASWSWRRVTAVTALGFAAMAYRVPGIVVVPATALYALVTWRQSRGRPLIPVLIWSAVGVAALASRVASLPFAEYLLPSIADFAERLTNVARVYRAAVFDLQQYPFADGRLNDAYHLLASIALVAGTAALLWRERRSLLTSLFVCYLALLVLSPAIDGRYLWPLYPVIAAGTILGLTAAWRLIARVFRRPRLNPAPVALALVLILLGGLWQALKAVPPQSLDRHPDAQSLFDWLRERNAQRPMRVVFHNPRVLTLETRIPAMGALLATPRNQLRAMREREMTHIIWQNAETDACRARLLNALPREYPGFFVLEYGNATFRVYRINNDDPLPADTWADRPLSVQLCRSLPPA